MRFRPGVEIYSELFAVKRRMPLVTLVAACLRSCASPCRAEICQAIIRNNQMVVVLVLCLPSAPTLLLTRGGSVIAFS